MEYQREPYVVQECLMIVEFVAPMSGRLNKLPDPSYLEQLHSFSSLSWSVSPGDQISSTIDVFSSPGCVVLRHLDSAQIQADYKAIREWECLAFRDLNRETL
jgi:hypothetical protein